MYMYKEDLALNNLQWFIWEKTQPNQIIYIWYTCIKKIWHYTNQIIQIVDKTEITMKDKLESFTLVKQLH